MEHKQFAQVEEEYFRLRGQLATGRITRAHFEAALKSLMLTDSQGHWWVIHPDSGKWNMFDGNVWVEGQPPTLPPAWLPERAPSLPPPPSARPAYAARRAGFSPLLVLLTVGSIGLVILISAIVLYTTQSPQTIALATAAAPIQASTPSLMPIGGAATTAKAMAATQTDAGIQDLANASSETLLLSPQEFGTNAEALAASVAELNRAQLQFIRDAKTLLAQQSVGQANQQLDQELCQVAANAMRVGRISDALARTIASQDNGSETALKMSQPYLAVARLGFAQVIEAQNLRDELARGTLARTTAVNTIAEYGARMWNPQVLDPNVSADTAPGNPFLQDTANAATIPAVEFLSQDLAQQFKDRLGSKLPRLWLATAQQQTSRTISVPVPTYNVELSNQSLLDRMTTLDGQKDADRARQYAAAQLNLKPGASSTTGDFQVALSTVAFADQDLMGELPLFPTFSDGNGWIVSSQQNASGGIDLIQDSHKTTSNRAPEPGETNPVVIQAVANLINLRIEHFSNTRQILTGPSNTHVGESTQYEIDFDVVGESSIDDKDYDIFIYCFVSGGSGSKGLAGGHSQGPRFRIHLHDTVELDYHSNDGYLLCNTSRWGNDDARFKTEARLQYVVDDVKTLTPTPTSTSTLTETSTPTASSTSTVTTTPTPSSTVTSTSTATEKPTSTNTTIARATPTATKRPTPTATPAPFTMNGTFSISWGGKYYTTGFIQLVVNPLSGAVSGSINGEGTYAGDDKCQDGSVKPYSTTRQFAGDLIGTADLNSGALQLGQVDGTMGGTVSLSGGCSDPMTMGLPPTLTLDGTLDSKNHTAKGRIFSTLDYDPGEGDWHAGE